MQKTRNLNKKVIIILLLINVIVITISSSYALFQKTIVQKDIVKLQMGNTDITTTIENYSNNLITLASGESKTLNITLSNITEYDILYQMYYTVESGTGTITTTELSSNPKGTMNNTKTLSITIQNNNTSEITIKVATKGALINSSITLEENEYEFLTDITPPTITISVASSTAGVSSWYSAISIKGVATDDKSTVSTISSCITTSTTCTPNSATSASTKTVSITGSNTTARKVCFNATDTAGNTSDTICSSTYLVDQTAPSVTNVSDAGSGKITFTASDSHSGVYQYCVNQNASSTSGCSWKTASSGEQTTDEVATEDGNYYVHVRDKAYKIGHSSVVAMTVDPNAAKAIIETYGTGGLIAVNTSGTIYSSSGTIREYRYSGLNVNNYIKFNNGEMWRIIGVFKNSAGEWNLKLVRNTYLKYSEMVSSYTYGGKTFRISYSNNTSDGAYWNKPASTPTTNYNDWTTAGLQYWLNDSNGYLKKLSSGAKALIDTNYTYYLGNVGVSSDDQDTTITAYTNERTSTKIHSGNKATWNGAIALIYPSDIGYTASSSYWSSKKLYDYANGPADTSWLVEMLSSAIWTLSPSSDDAANRVATCSSNGYIKDSDVGLYNETFPVLNLLSTATIEDNGADGSESNPYVIIE